MKSGLFSDKFDEKNEFNMQPRPQGFSLKKWVGREKALASAGHVYSLNIPEKLIYMQPAGFALTEVERSNNGNNNTDDYAGKEGDTNLCAT